MGPRAYKLNLRNRGKSRVKVSRLLGLRYVNRLAISECVEKTERIAGIGRLFGGQPGNVGIVLV